MRIFKYKIRKGKCKLYDTAKVEYLYGLKIVLSNGEEKLELNFSNTEADKIKSEIDNYRTDSWKNLYKQKPRSTSVICVLSHCGTESKTFTWSKVNHNKILEYGSTWLYLPIEYQF